MKRLARLLLTTVKAVAFIVGSVLYLASLVLYLAFLGIVATILTGFVLYIGALIGGAILVCYFGCWPFPINIDVGLIVGGYVELLKGVFQTIVGFIAGLIAG